MKRKTISGALVVVLLGLMAATFGPPFTASAHPPQGGGPYSMQQGWGPGMMGPGQMPMMGPGMMGHGMGPGMGPSMMYPNMMGWGMGPGMPMGPGMMGYGPGPRGAWQDRMRALPQDLSVDDVRHMMEHQLSWQGNPNLEIGKIEEKDKDTIVAEIVTKNGSLVQRLEINRHTGWMQPAQ